MSWGVFEPKVQTLSFRRLAGATTVAALGAASANTLIFFIGDATGAIPRDFVFSTSNQPFSAGLVASFSLVGVAVGGVLMAGLAKFMQRPVKAFRVISGVFLLLFSLLPFAIGAPPSMVLILEVMHLVAGSIAVILIGRVALPEHNNHSSLE